MMEDSETDSTVPEIEETIIKFILDTKDTSIRYHDIHRAVALAHSKIFNRFQIQDTIYKMVQQKRIIVGEENAIAVTYYGMLTVQFPQYRLMFR